MIPPRKTALLTIVAIALAAPACAQDAGWDFSVSGYMWLPKSTTKVDTPWGTAKSVLSIGDAMEALDFGSMISGTARRGRWAITGDLIYLNLSDDTSTPFGALFSNLHMRTKLASLSGYGMYEVYETDGTRVELGLGARAMKSTLDLTFSPGTLAGRQQHISDSWIDPLIAARISTQLNDRWSVTASLDYGGFGIGSASNETWQAIATLGYALSEDWTLMGGYRHLFVDRQNQGTDYSLEMTGLIFGATYRF